MRLEDASVLLVDDEPLLLDMLREFFEHFGIRVFCAGDGVQALQVLAAERIDLVIADIRMPEMDGITLLKKIKAGGSHTPSLIFITGFADIGVRDAYDLGAEALLEKPIEWDGMIEVARRSLSEPWERWEKQENLPASPVLRRSFRSLSSAFEEHQIAFGRGGFCIENTEFLEPGPVHIALHFVADDYVLVGQGVIRWLADNQMGVELTHVAEKSRARAVKLTEKASSFIPRTTKSDYQTLAA